MSVATTTALTAAAITAASTASRTAEFGAAEVGSSGIAPLLVVIAAIAIVGSIFLWWWKQ